MNAETNARVHAICKAVREDRYAGIDDANARCERCPAMEQTPYGPAVRGCYLHALELFNIAVYECPYGQKDCPGGAACTCALPGRER